MESLLWALIRAIISIAYKVALVAAAVVIAIILWSLFITYVWPVLYNFGYVAAWAAAGFCIFAGVGWLVEKGCDKLGLEKDM